MIFNLHRSLSLVIAICFLASLSAWAGQPFFKGGQQGWYHDDGIEGGFFHTFDSFQVAGSADQPRKIHLFLPRYYEQSQQRYPVVYFNDGQTAFYKGGLGNRTLDIAQLVSKLYSAEQLQQVIVVAVSPLNRNIEYTHKPVAGQNCCGVEQYTQYMANAVKPFIDANYRTLRAPKDTLIAGASHGGLAAFYMAMRRPDAFGNVLSQSGSFWVGLDSAALGAFLKPLKTSALLKMAAATLNNAAVRPKIYLDWGLVRDGGFHNSFVEERATARGRELDQLLQENFGYVQNVNLKTVEDVAGVHDETS